MKKRLILSLVGLLYAAMAWTQTISVVGYVSDKENGDALEGAKVSVVGASTGTITDDKGRFSLQVTLTDGKSQSLRIEYLGYAPMDVPVSADTKQELNLQMTNLSVLGAEVVITGSRVAENVLESPVSIQKIGVNEIRGAASGDFYQSMGNLAGVDITTSSMSFKTINTRGFNTTSPVRSVQFVDGMDNQAPGLNFPIGNLVGATDLDLQSVELISGAASALYGPNAFQGVVSMTTKDPFLSEGLSVQFRGATRSQAEIQARYAKVLGAK